MSRKDVTDLMVCQAYADRNAEGAHLRGKWPYEILASRTGECEKVCYRAMERACDRGLIDYGVTLRSGWVTPEGEALLDHEKDWFIPGSAMADFVEGLKDLGHTVVDLSESLEDEPPPTGAQTS